MNTPSGYAYDSHIPRSIQQRDEEAVDNQKATPIKLPEIGGKSLSIVQGFDARKIADKLELSNPLLNTVQEIDNLRERTIKKVAVLAINSLEASHITTYSTFELNHSRVLMRNTEKEEISEEIQHGQKIDLIKKINTKIPKILLINETNTKPLEEELVDYLHYSLSVIDAFIEAYFKAPNEDGKKSIRELLQNLDYKKQELKEQKSDQHHDFKVFVQYMHDLFDNIVDYKRPLTPSHSPAFSQKIVLEADVKNSVSSVDTEEATIISSSREEEPREQVTYEERAEAEEEEVIYGTAVLREEEEKKTHPIKAPKPKLGSPPLPPERERMERETQLLDNLIDKFENYREIKHIAQVDGDLLFPAISHSQEKDFSSRLFLANPISFLKNDLLRASKEYLPEESSDPTEIISLLKKFVFAVECDELRLMKDNDVKVMAAEKLRLFLKNIKPENLQETPPPSETSPLSLSLLLELLIRETFKKEEERQEGVQRLLIELQLQLERYKK